MPKNLEDIHSKVEETRTDKVSTTCKDKSVTVGNTSTVVLEANSNRKYALFVNDDDEVIYLARGSLAVMNEGIPLAPNRRGIYEINETNMYRDKITAICSSGSKNLCVEECW